MNRKYLLLLSGLLILSANVFSMQTFNLKQLLTASIHRVTNIMNQSLYTEEIEAKPKWVKKEAEKRNTLKEELTKLFPVKKTNFFTKNYGDLLEPPRWPIGFNKLLEEVQNNHNYLYQFIYAGREDDLKEVLATMGAYKNLLTIHNAQQNENTLEKLKKATSKFILLNSTKYSPFAIAIMSEEHVEKKIKILKKLNIKPTKDDKLLSKLDFYLKTPELTKFNVLICALLAYDFPKEKINEEQESNAILPIDITQDIVSYIYNDKKALKLICDKNPLIAYDSFFSKDLA